ncbi:MAG: lactate utilization protein [Bacillota bacterium]|nr:lactate utilization protein [Bacillota bacterium]
MIDLEKLTKNLKANGFEVAHFNTKEEAREYLSSKLNGRTIGFGGSITTEEMQLIDALKENNTLLHHWHEGILSEAAKADVYISSANAIAETGEIINIDGTGNRVSSMAFGHEEYYMIIGKNKIAKDYDKALWRARNIAAPKNAQRLNRNTPCAKKGDKCYNCNSPERICRCLNVLWKKPGSFKTFEIILVDENLGY